jgi:hypothetical protein
MPKPACGPHVELASNDAVRVTRCPCGTVHLTLQASGVTVRMSSEALRGVLGGLKLAVDRADDKSQLGSQSIN